MSQIIVRFQPDQESPAWIDAPYPQTVQTDAIGAKNLVSVIVPTQMLLLTTTTIPKTRHPLKTIPYAIEDQLLTDPDEQHFAISSTDQPNTYAVAAVHKKTWQAWLKYFDTQQWTVQNVVPDVLALPWQANEWTIAQEPTHILIRTGAFSGYAIPVDHIDALWDSLKDASPELCRTINADDALIANLKSRGFTTVVKQAPCALGPFDPQQVLEPALNLLHSRVRQRTKTPAQNRRGWFTSSMLIVLIVSLFASKIITHRALDTFNQKADQMLSQQTQGKGDINDPNALTQLQTQIEQLSEQQKRIVFLRDLDTIGKALKDAPHGPLQKIQYSSHHWQLRMTAQKTEQKAIIHALEKQGYITTGQMLDKKTLQIHLQKTLK